MIGGNIGAKLELCDPDAKDDMGVRDKSWIEGKALTGWLDFVSGGNVQVVSKVLEQSTHVFICDWTELPAFGTGEARLSVGGQSYDVVYVDDPMGLHRHLEFYLSYVGDRNGS
jgi:hypothetical protein